MADVRLADEQLLSVVLPTLDSFVQEEHVTDEWLDKRDIKELRIAGQAPLRSDYCGENRKGLVAKVMLARDRPFQVSVHADVLAGVVIEKILGDCLAEFLVQHKQLKLGCLDYSFELCLFHLMDLYDLPPLWMQILKMVNVRCGGEYLGKSYSYQPELLEESPLVYGYPQELVVICEPFADLTKPAKDATLSAMVESGPRADVVTKLETESFASLSADVKKVAIEVTKSLVSNLPAEALADLFKVASFSDEQRSAVHEATGGEIPLERRSGAELIAGLREKGVSMKEMGARLGVNQGHVSKIASGKIEQPRPDIIVALIAMHREKEKSSL